MFLNICKMYELNPFKRREIYLVKYSPTQQATTLVGYETYLKRAEHSKNWNGMEAITEGKPEDNTLRAVVKIYRKDWQHPFTHEVWYSEYVQKKAGRPVQYCTGCSLKKIRKKFKRLRILKNLKFD